MKKIILLAVCVLSISTGANAQEVAKKTKSEKVAHGKLTPEQRAQKHVDGLNAEVTLTEDQKTKVYDLALAKAKKVDEIKASHAGKPDGNAYANREIEPVRKQFRENLKAILTPEQFEKMKAKQKEMKAAGKTTSADHN